MAGEKSGEPPGHLVAPGLATPTSGRFTGFGTELTLPPGSSFQFWQASGSGVESPSADAALKANTTAPEVNIPEMGSAKGGGTTIDAKAIPKLTSMALLYGLGGLAVLGGIVFAVSVRDHWKAGAGLAAAGVVLIIAARAVETQPLLGWLVFVVVIGIVAYMVWLGRRSQAAFTFARAESGGLATIGGAKIADGDHAGLTVREAMKQATANAAAKVNRSASVERVAKAAKKKAIIAK